MSVPVHLGTSSARVAPKVRAFLDHAAEALLKLEVINEADSPFWKSGARSALAQSLRERRPLPRDVR
ncbi:MAG: hypothetical protein ABI619_14100 [Betaproteobacteria bacterium]